MSSVSFINDAGVKLFDSDKSDVVAAHAHAHAAAPNHMAADAILICISTQFLSTRNSTAKFDSATGAAVVSGQLPDQATHEKNALCCDNTDSVEQVDRQLSVDAPADESRCDTARGGATQSKISQQMVGYANRSRIIFKANLPGLKNPDRIYPDLIVAHSNNLTVHFAAFPVSPAFSH